MYKIIFLGLVLSLNVNGGTNELTAQNWDCLAQPWPHGEIKSYTDIYRNKGYNEIRFFRFFLHALKSNDNTSKSNAPELLFQLFDTAKNKESKTFYQKLYFNLFQINLDGSYFSDVQKSHLIGSYNIESICAERRKLP